MKRLLSVLLLLLVAGCAGADPHAPPEIRWGEDPCDFCHMVIEDPRFAAGYRLATGEQRIFDDIGDMVYALAREQAPVASAWVRDYEQDRWLPADTVYLIEGGAFESPMGYGLAAVQTRERAEALAGPSGAAVLTWQQLRTRGVRPPRGGQ